jgi:hypothetical protein
MCLNRKQILLLLANLCIFNAAFLSNDYHESLLALDKPQTGKSELFLEELDSGRKLQKSTDLDEVR